MFRWTNAVRSQVSQDLRSDRFLVVILAVTGALSLFWVWHGVPNFATWDERDRLLDALVAYGSVFSEPSLAGLRDGIAWGRTPFGATFYLYALLLLPVVAVAVLVGQADAIAGIAFPSTGFSGYDTWRTTPAWVWTASILLARLANVAFAVGSVYLTYRLGVAVRSRTAGRVAALALGLNFQVVVLAHEGGEDLPALFCLLVALVLLVGYVQDGRKRRFYAASLAGGLAMGFKLTAAAIAPTVLLAFALRRRETGGLRWRAVLRSGQIRTGAALGAVALLASFPDLLVGNVYPVIERLFGQTGYRIVDAVGPEGPTWWWYLHGYATSFGLPLTVAGAVAVVVTAGILRRQRDAPLALVGGFLGLFAVLFLPWHDFRPHHLLPTFPPLAVLVAVLLGRIRRRRRTAARLLTAGLLVSTGLYAGVGTLQYGDLPRADARAWLSEETEAGDRVLVYQRGFEGGALPHGQRVVRPDDIGPCPAYAQLTRRELLYLRDVPSERRVRYTRQNTSERAAHVRHLLNGSGYEVARVFGDGSPGLVPERSTPGSVPDLLVAGVVPHSDRYGDEQELAGSQTIVLLRRAGSCRGLRRLPW